ncbi:Trigger factor [Gammaproteobacteria bacterium]
MQVSLEVMDGLERRVTLCISEDQIAQEVQKRLQTLARTLQISGFRPGKVPMAVVQKQFSAEVRKEAIAEMLALSLTKKLDQEHLHPVILPSIEPLPRAVGASGSDDLCYCSTFEVYPEVRLSPLKDVVIRYPEVVIEDTDVDYLIERIRKEHAAWTLVDRPAVLGDRVKMDFSGSFLDGTSFHGNEGKNVLVVLGSNRLLEELERGLIGAVARETRIVELVFPQDYQHKEVAGKAARFTMTAQSIEGPHLPELDEAFFRDFSISDGSIEGLRAAVQQRMEADFAKRALDLVKNQVREAIYERNPILLPKALIEKELKELQSGEGKELDPAELEDLARRFVAIGILFGEIVQKVGLKLDPLQLRAYVRSLAEEYDDPDQVENWFLSDTSRKDRVEAILLEDKVIEWVLTQVQVERPSTRFSELMGASQS